MNTSESFQEALERAQNTAQRYLRDGNSDALDESVSAWQKALQHPGFNKIEADFQTAVLNESGGAYLRRYWGKGNVNDLEQAIKVWQSILSQLPEKSEYKAGLINNLGTALNARYARTGMLSDLCSAISILREAVALEDNDFSRCLSALNNLGAAFFDYYSHTGELQSLNTAIKIFQQIVEVSSVNSIDFASRIKNLGVMLRTRYSHSGALADLEMAIALYRQAIALTEQDSIEYANQLNNLANSVCDRYLRIKEKSDLDNSIRYAQQAIKIVGDNPFLSIPFIVGLGSKLGYRYALTSALQDLDSAIENFRQALSLIPENSPERAVLLSNLGGGLRDRHAQTEKREDLEAAITILEQAANLSNKDSPDHPRRLHNLGGALCERYLYTKQPLDLEAGLTQLKAAAHSGLLHAPEVTLLGTRGWLTWALSRQSYQEIEEAYTYARQAAEKLLKAQATRRDKESWLKDMQGIAAQAAYAFAKLGKPKQAALALEQGSARLLSETLALNHADIEALRDSPQPALHQAYTDALTAYQDAQHIQKPEIQQQALRDAWKNLEAVIAQIRQVEGFEQFLQPAEFEEIVQAAEQSLLYLAVTAQGGVGILVQRENAESVHCSAFFLPQLDDTQLRERLNAYLDAYQQRHQDHMAKALWEARLQALCRWLGEVFLKPVREALPNLKEITLIPLGLLNLLPLHAASDGQRSALDDLRIRYAPNARSLNRARAVRESAGSNKLFVACNPQQNLHFSELETAIAQSFIPKQWVLYHQDATIEAVKARLPQCNVLHFSCHGNTDTQNPLDSALLLADGKLTLDSLLKTRLNARLVILSACETGMLADLQRAEEFVSLSTGLLQAGSTAVIASLWSVRDDSTMILISRFYYLWRCEQLEPAEALRQAQIWLRDGTPQQRIAFFREVLPEAAVIELEGVLSRDFSHPYHWAGFGLVGE